MSVHLSTFDKPEIKLNNVAVSFRKGGRGGGGGGSSISLSPYQIAAVVWCIAWALLGLVAIVRVCSPRHRSWVLAFPILAAFFAIIGNGSFAGGFRYSYVFNALMSMIVYMGLVSVALQAARSSARVGGRERRGKMALILAVVGYVFAALYMIMLAPTSLITSHTYQYSSSKVKVNAGWAAATILSSLFLLAALTIAFVIWGLGLTFRGMSKRHKILVPVAGALLFIAWISDIFISAAFVNYDANFLNNINGTVVWFAWNLLFQFLSTVAVVALWRPNTDAATGPNAALSPPNVPYKVDTNGSFTGGASTPAPQQPGLMYQPQMVYMQPGQGQPQMMYMQPGQMPPGQQPMMMPGQPMMQGQPMMMQPQQYQQYPQQYMYVQQPGQQSPQLQPQHSPPLAHSPAPQQPQQP